ncbi:MAG: polysaccharide deacetylase family protein [Saprospiraceae bacterium]|nr:polysaccharide deacetylase family protein [Saprospiraceae bacterium]
MYFIKTPALLKWFYPEVVWKMPEEGNGIYLTFDDGPIPVITPWVLDILDEYHAKATFFCVGENVKKYPEIYEEIKRRGHAIGNHTFKHISGWKTPKVKYLEDVALAGQYIETNLFRPPYGKMTKAQIREISKTHKLIYWDVLSGDFDKSMEYKKCLKKLKQKTEAGSIVVFHDSHKSDRILKQVLPEILDHWQHAGFQFKTIEF